MNDHNQNADGGPPCFAVDREGNIFEDRKKITAKILLNRDNLEQ